MMSHTWYLFFMWTELERIWFTLNKFPMLFLYEAYNNKYLQPEKNSHRMNWNSSVVISLWLELIDTLIWSWFSQISVNFSKRIRFVYVFDIFTAPWGEVKSSAVIQKRLKMFRKFLFCDKGPWNTDNTTSLLV